MASCRTFNVARPNLQHPALHQSHPASRPICNARKRHSCCPVSGSNKLPIPSHDSHNGQVFGGRGSVPAAAARTTQSSAPQARDNGKGKGGDAFSWTRAWWPVLPVDYLHQDRPNGVTLLGADYVVWYESSTHKWRMFEDRCPHRLAALSEGKNNIVKISAAHVRLTRTVIVQRSAFSLMHHTLVMAAALCYFN